MAHIDKPNDVVLRLTRDEFEMVMTALHRSEEYGRTRELVALIEDLDGETT